MIALAALAGVLGGAGTIGGMWLSGMLTERSGVSVLLVAIAFFYPVFAVMDGIGLLGTAVHVAVFVGFLGLAAYGFRTGMWVLALGIAAHGVFDLITVFTGHPGPVWWPAFCGSLDIVAGACLLALGGRRGVVS